MPQTLISQRREAKQMNDAEREAFAARVNKLHSSGMSISAMSVYLKKPESTIREIIKNSK